MFFSFIAVFLATAWVTIGGLIGKLTVSAGYLKILVGALLVEVTGALILQFKTLDLTTTPQQLEKEIMAVQVPITSAGSSTNAKEKLKTLIESYRTHAAANTEAEKCQKKLVDAQGEISLLTGWKNTISGLFRDCNAVADVNTAIDEMMANQGVRPLIDQACAKHNFYDVSQPQFVWRALKGLKPDHPVAQSLLSLRKNRLGPFASSEFKVFVSVPSPSIGDKHDAVVRTDSPFRGSWIHLADAESGGDVWVHATRLHERSPIPESDTGEKYELVQISLSAAADLFRTRTFETSRKLAQAIMQ